MYKITPKAVIQTGSGPICNCCNFHIRPCTIYTQFFREFENKDEPEILYICNNCLDLFNKNFQELKDKLYQQNNKT